ncbi:hypothetical protein G4L39_13780 [Limisphaera ngatamarikiensis]|uniref:Uncharacterized protein n=1 Tax=Limisphaera ngatamarikiensis TaxID=1324935 RepID=A0A6M1RS74_9BACT|nr:hypothetical protein [Limisphaera ngatamarikiensis]
MHIIVDVNRVVLDWHILRIRASGGGPAVVHAVWTVRRKGPLSIHS